MTFPAVLMIGTGEYTTGYVHGAAASSDKGAGVVALTLFDLRRRGKVSEIHLAGTNGTRFPGIRAHLQQAIANRYAELDVACVTYPADDIERDEQAFKAALDRMEPGDLVTIFTPDDTHCELAMAAVSRGLHVLIAKPLVKTVAEHREILDAARRHKVVVAMEVHKRWDPIYADARDRIAGMGGFSFFQSYMSQPKSQLDTFRRWAGRSSDISYYLNAHHIDFHHWSVGSFARPVSVVAAAATGVAISRNVDAEDTITLLTRWQNANDGSTGTAVYTSSWIAPRSDVHSQQRFFYMGHSGELQVDQAHRGYSVALDGSGLASPNPLFMKYTPDPLGRFAGQLGYGYRSIEAFVDAVQMIRDGKAVAHDFDHRLATAATTLPVTAILEAGRRSLDQGGKEVAVELERDG